MHTPPMTRYPKSRPRRTQPPPQTINATQEAHDRTVARAKLWRMRAKHLRRQGKGLTPQKQG